MGILLDQTSLDGGHTHTVLCTLPFQFDIILIVHEKSGIDKGKGKAVPLQVWTGPEGSRKLRLPDFVTTAQDVRLSALRTGRLYPRKCSWYSFLSEAESTPGP